MQTFNIIPPPIKDHVKNNQSKMRAFEILLDVLGVFKEYKKELSSKRWSKKYEELCDMISYISSLLDCLNTEDRMEMNEHLFSVKSNRVNIESICDYINKKDKNIIPNKNHMYYNTKNIQEASKIVGDHIREILPK